MAKRVVHDGAALLLQTIPHSVPHMSLAWSQQPPRQRGNIKRRQLALVLLSTGLGASALGKVCQRAESLAAITSSTTLRNSPDETSRPSLGSVLWAMTISSLGMTVMN
jgi:hypothetical protein